MTRQQSSAHDHSNKEHASELASRASGRGDTTVREAGHQGAQRVRERISSGGKAEQRGGRH